MRRRRSCGATSTARASAVTTEQGKGSNRTKPAVRTRYKDIFGAQTNDLGGTLVRTIGLVRAKARVGVKTLACKLHRLNPRPA